MNTKKFSMVDQMKGIGQRIVITILLSCIPKINILIAKILNADFERRIILETEYKFLNALRATINTTGDQDNSNQYNSSPCDCTKTSDCYTTTSDQYFLYPFDSKVTEETEEPAWRIWPWFPEEHEPENPENVPWSSNLDWTCSPEYYEDFSVTKATRTAVNLSYASSTAYMTPIFSSESRDSTESFSSTFIYTSSMLYTS